MDSTGVVADHATERTVGMGRWIRTKGQMILFGRVAQVIKDHARLYACLFSTWVEFEDTAHVLGEIHDHRYVATLSGEASSTTPSQNGSAIATRHRHGLDDIINLAREDHADRHLPVIRAIGGI